MKKFELKKYFLPFAFPMDSGISAAKVADSGEGRSISCGRIYIPQQIGFYGYLFAGKEYLY